MIMPVKIPSHVSLSPDKSTCIIKLENVVCVYQIKVMYYGAPLL